MKLIRVLIVDDHPLMRSALDVAISTASDMEVVAEASTGLDVAHLVSTLKPDVIIMDLMMPKMNGLEAIDELSHQNPNIYILVLSSAVDEDTIVKAFQLGAIGYITKDAQRDELIRAIHRVALGEIYLPLKIAGRLINQIGKIDDEKLESQLFEEVLTLREKDVLGLLGKGLSNREIAEALYLAEATVRVHLLHIKEKLGFSHRREMVVYAVKYHLKTENGVN